MSRFAALEEEDIEVKECERELSLDSTALSWADMGDMDDLPLVTPTKKVVNEPKKNGLEIKCRDCKKKFTFPKNKIELFEERGWNMPKSCRECLNFKKLTYGAPRSHAPRRVLDV